MWAAIWNARAALLYSVGGWTVLGAMLHYNNSSSSEPGNESDHQANPAGPNQVVSTDTVLGVQVTTIVTYREDQPPLTRLLRRVKSYFDSNDGPPSGN